MDAKYMATKARKMPRSLIAECHCVTHAWRPLPVTRWDEARSRETSQRGRAGAGFFLVAVFAK